MNAPIPHTEELAMLACRNCGAGLPVRRGEAQVSCAYCHHDSPVDAAQLSWQRRMPEVAREAEREGLEALRHAIARKLAPSRGAAFGSIGVIFTAGMFMALVAHFAVGRGIHVAITMLGSWVLGGLGVALVLRHLHRRAPRLADDELAGVQAQVQREPSKGSCPECGVAVVVPPLTAGIGCAYCGSPLLAAAGMLVRWVNDARARRQEWAQQAAAILDRVRLHHKRMDRVAVFLLFVFPWFLVIGLAGGLLALASLGITPTVTGTTPDVGAKVWVKDGSQLAEVRVVKIYGKLALIDQAAYGRRWVSLKEDFQTPRDPGPKPKDPPADFAVGQTVKAPLSNGTMVTATVKEIYGRLVKVQVGSRPRWVEASELGGSSQKRRGRRKRRPR